VIAGVFADILSVFRSEIEKVEYRIGEQRLNTRHDYAPTLIDQISSSD
jgi:hypothetical protein